jgi:predicted ArsR family transcriptional regulator
MAQIAEALGVKEARVTSHLAHLKADKKVNVVIDEKSGKVSITA